MGEPDDWPDYDEIDDGDDDVEVGEEECGRWMNGKLSRQCALAGTEWCDWCCPIGTHNRRTA